MAAAVARITVDHLRPLRPGLCHPADSPQRDSVVGARGDVVGRQVADRLELVERLGVAAGVPQGVGQLGADVHERRAHAQRLLQLLDRVIEQADGRVGVGEVAMHVGDLAASERLQLVEATAAAGAVGLLVHLAAIVVAAQLVVDDREVERRFGVVRVDGQRPFECFASLLWLPVLVVDEAQHVVDIGEVLVSIADGLEVWPSALVLACPVVLAAVGQVLLDLGVHEDAGSTRRDYATEPAPGA